MSSAAKDAHIRQRIYQEDVYYVLVWFPLSLSRLWCLLDSICLVTNCCDQDFVQLCPE
jgi:hypothetical protein